MQKPAREADVGASLRQVAAAEQIAREGAKYEK